MKDIWEEEKFNIPDTNIGIGSGAVSKTRKSMPF